MHDTKPTSRRVLYSTADKAGLVEFAQKLESLKFDCIATGTTAKLLRQHQINVTDVSNITHFPELMNGRVKTLHPNIHAGILARRGQDDATLATHNIKPIDIVVVTYTHSKRPFQLVIAPSPKQLSKLISAARRCYAPLLKITNT